MAELPIRLLTEEVPAYEREGRPSPPASAPALPPEPPDLSRVLDDLLASENICSRFAAYSRYDHTVQANTVVGPGLDAALLRVRGTDLGLALTTDCNPRYCAADPFVGAQIAVAEAARNLACRGARPIAATDCLNFGNPERPEVYWQLRRAVEGLAEACRTLEIPVVSGNVSLYNETNGQAIKPSPIVGLVGLVDDYRRAAVGGFRRAGDAVVLLGPPAQQVTVSEYLAICHGIEHGPAPNLDLATEAAVQRLCRELIADGVVEAAHDCSEGGLAVALAESCLVGGLGFGGHPAALAALVDAAGGRPDLALFGEGQSRIVVACAAERTAEVLARAAAAGVDAALLGTVGGARFEWSSALSRGLDDLGEAWFDGFERLFA